MVELVVELKLVLVEPVPPESVPLLTFQLKLALLPPNNSIISPTPCSWPFKSSNISLRQWRGKRLENQKQKDWQKEAVNAKARARDACYGEH